MTKNLIMSEMDIPFALELVEYEGWNYTEDDFLRLLKLNPSGCFICWKAGKRVGIITTSIYGNYAFIGTLIIKKEYRKQGLGRSLLEFTISYLRDSGVKTIELDGVFSAVKLYRDLGFHDKYLSLRFEKSYGTKSEDTVLYHPQDFSGLPELDFELTRIHRSDLLNEYLKVFKDHVFIFKRKEIESYAIVKAETKKSVSVTFFISRTTEGAEIILNSILKKYQDKTIRIGVPELNRASVHLLMEKGFIYREPSLRMYLGKRVQYENFMYGIISPEKG
ncbi:MAG TPA: GNAT family N-acetyltransferase [Firmicutes bacterium]|nr:GNAT family N-acetyltransferase [Bacillota bacterium]